MLYNTTFFKHDQVNALFHYLANIEPHTAKYCTQQGYNCKIEWRPYFNCRENGFVLKINNIDKDIRTNSSYIAFFEHRNVDSLCGVYWEDNKYIKDFYTPDDIPEKYYPDKWVVEDFGHLGLEKAHDFLLDTIQDKCGEKAKKGKSHDDKFINPFQ